MTLCAGGQVCEGAGLCVAAADAGPTSESCTSECTENATTCSGTSLSRCVLGAGGCFAWAPAESCGPGMHCADGACVADPPRCVAECSSGQTKCGAAGVQTCWDLDHDGCAEWGDEEPCSPDRHCEGGQCVNDALPCEDHCASGATQCAGDLIQACETQADGCRDWSPPAFCPSLGQACRLGSCVFVPCSNTCTSRTTSCLDFRIRTCVLRDNGCYEWSTPLDCFPGEECGGFSCQPIQYVEDMVSATVTYPFLYRRTPVDVFPTYLAHLIGTTVQRSDMSANLVCAALRNSSTYKTFSLKVHGGMPGYGPEVTRTMTLAPRESRTECLNPSMDLAALYALTSPVPAAIEIEVEALDAATVLRSESHPVDVPIAAMVYFAGNSSINVSDLVSVMSMPAQPEVTDTMAGVQARTWPVGGYGASAYSRVGTFYASWSGFLNVTYYTSDLIFLDQGESATWKFIEITGTSSNLLDAYIFDDYNFNQWRSGGAYTVAQRMEEVTTGSDATFTATTAGWYHIVVGNWYSDRRDYVMTRSLTREDVTRDVLRTIYEEIKSRRGSFQALPATFFNTPQRVRWPSESLTDPSANALDGTMLFSSLGELAGVDPVVVLKTGHALFGVRSRGPTQPVGSGRVLAVETTTLGTDPFWTAYQRGIAALSGTYRLVDVAVLRAQGVKPLPR